MTGKGRGVQLMPLHAKGEHVLLASILVASDLPNIGLVDAAPSVTRRYGCCAAATMSSRDTSS